MQAQIVKPRYLGGLYLEAGVNIIVTLTFLNFGVSLILARPGDNLTMIFPSIYLFQCFVFVIYAWFNELIWQRILVFGIIILSTVAEVAIFGWFSYTAYKKLSEDENDDLTKMAIITGCSFAGWLILRVFTLITLHKYYTEL